MSAVFHEINLRPQINISHLSETACLSSKQFGRIFADYVGTTPKEFIRIIRMQRALSMLQQDATIPFVQVAYECGFSDQSHMIKEFKLFPVIPLRSIFLYAPLIPIISLNSKDVSFFYRASSCYPTFAMSLQRLSSNHKKKRDEKINCIF